MKKTFLNSIKCKCYSVHKPLVQKFIVLQMQGWPLFWCKPRSSSQKKQEKSSRHCNLAAACLTPFLKTASALDTQQKQIKQAHSDPGLFLLLWVREWIGLVPAGHTAGFNRSMTPGGRTEQRRTPFEKEDLTMLANYSRTAISQGKQTNKKRISFMWPDKSRFSSTRAVKSWAA